MSADSTRRAAAVLLVILGGAALWWAGSAAQASASANDAVVVTIAAARESRGRDGRGFDEAGSSGFAGDPGRSGALVGGERSTGFGIGK